MKKSLKIAAVIIVMILGCVIVKFNVYDTQFYSVFFNTAKIHTPLELEEISYISHLSPELERAIVLNEEEDLAMWEDFLDWLNNTEFKKVRSTWGRSYTGEGIWLKFKDVEEELEETVTQLDDLTEQYNNLKKENNRLL